jgi:hypothetical protein
LAGGRGVRVPGEQDQQEQYPGSTDRELRRPPGDATRDQARHHELPTYRETNYQTHKAHYCPAITVQLRQLVTQRLRGTSMMESSFPLC